MPDQQEARLGQQVGEYRLVRQLGGGGFGMVYLAEHVHEHIQVAVKVLKIRFTEHEHYKDFVNEARTMMRLCHSHIVPLLDFGISGHDLPFLVMEYAPEGTLRDRHLRRERLELSAIVSYVDQLASALQYAHDHRVIHRDIKPENVLVRSDGTLLLSDFGMAKLLEQSLLVSQQKLAGTPRYMAPEQHKGKPCFASDQYALAVVVYEWICGTTPFQGTLFNLAAQHMNTPPPPLRDHLPQLSEAVEQVVLKALAKAPEDRFERIQAFADALREAAQPPSISMLSSATQTGQIDPLNPTTPLSSTPSSASWTQASAVSPPDLARDKEMPVGHLSQQIDDTVSSSGAHSPLTGVFPSSDGSHLSKRHVSRRIVVASLAGVAGVSLVSGGIIWLMTTGKFKGPSSLIPTVPQTHPPSATITKGPGNRNPYIYRGHDQTPTGVYSAVWSPDGTRIASCAGTVHIWDATNGDRLLRHHAFVNDYNNAQKVAWSPDGTRIVSIENTQMEVWTANDGVFIAEHQSPLGWGDTLSWSPDSQRIVSGSDERPGSAEIWDAASGQTMLTYRGHVSRVVAVAWSPNGKWIASSGMGKLVHVWDATNAKQVYVYSGHLVNEVSSVAWSPDSRRVASAGNDGIVHVWDASTGGHVYIYQGHFHASDQYHTVTTVAWSPDGTRIASGDWNHLVQVWDAVSGKQIYTYTGHSDTITSVAWSPNGKRIASASRDGTVQVWPAP